MPADVPEVLSRRLRRFLVYSTILIIGSYIFLSYWAYSKEFYAFPAEWSDLLAGRGTAPAQYRIGVVFVAGFLGKLSHGHLAIRHSLALVDLVFLGIGLPLTLVLIARTRFYRAASYPLQCTTHFVAILLMLFYLSWTFWYHKPETIANFGSLAIAAALLAEWRRITPPVAALGLILISAYLGCVRADSGFSLNLGILLAALLPGESALRPGRGMKIVAGLAGLIAVVGVEYYIKHKMFPGNPFSDPLFQLVRNLKSPLNLFCVIFALSPYFVVVRLAGKHWSRLEEWERALVIASVVEFAFFFIVAKVDEVRVFLPYAMALLPTSAALLCREITGQAVGDGQKREAFVAN
jgi:hypothetical protein